MIKGTVPHFNYKHFGTVYTNNFSWIICIQVNVKRNEVVLRECWMFHKPTRCQRKRLFCRDLSELILLYIEETHIYTSHDITFWLHFSWFRFLDFRAMGNCFRKTKKDYSGFLLINGRKRKSRTKVKKIENPQWTPFVSCHSYLNMLDSVVYHDAVRNNCYHQHTRTLQKYRLNHSKFGYFFQPIYCRWIDSSITTPVINQLDVV